MTGHVLDQLRMAWALFLAVQLGEDGAAGMHQDDTGVARGKAAGMGPDIAWFTDPAGNILSILNG